MVYIIFLNLNFNETYSYNLKYPIFHKSYIYKNIVFLDFNKKYVYEINIIEMNSTLQNTSIHTLLLRVSMLSANARIYQIIDIIYTSWIRP